MWLACLFLIWFKSSCECCHYCRAAKIHPMVCSTFLLWWDWKGRLLFFLQMGSQDIKWWMFRSAMIKELQFHCSRGLRSVVFTPWLCHLSPDMVFWVPEAFLFLCQHYFSLNAAVWGVLNYNEVLVDSCTSPLASPWNSDPVAVRCSPEQEKRPELWLTAEAAYIFNNLCFVRECFKWW